MSDLDSENPENAFTTPLMKQYWELKSKIPDGFLLFRMGDFYEFFGADACEASRLLQITLTTREKNKTNPIPMAGVPHHSASIYIQKLLRAGKKVAIAEQINGEGNLTEDGKGGPGKGIVDREITRILTPGVYFEGEEVQENFLAVWFLSHATSKNQPSSTWILACIEASTGEILVTEAKSKQAFHQDLISLPIRHLLSVSTLRDDSTHTQRWSELKTIISPTVLHEKLPLNYLSLQQAKLLVQDHFGQMKFDPQIDSEDSIYAVGILIQYILKTQKLLRLSHLRVPTPFHKPDSLSISAKVLENLEALYPLENSENNSLYQLINTTKTAMGSRQLKRWMIAPLRHCEEIQKRQQAVKELAGGLQDQKFGLQNALSHVLDLERIVGRVGACVATPRDTLALSQSVLAMNGMVSLLVEKKLGQASVLENLLGKIIETLRALGPVVEEIKRTQVDPAPLSIKEGGIFKMGTHSQLDDLLNSAEHGKQWLLTYESQQREQTKISSLKVRANRVYGYYIEITQANLKLVPHFYRRRQTMVGTERFITDELENFEQKNLDTTFRQKELESILFEDLLQKVQSQVASVVQLATATGELDSLIALASLSSKKGWIFPVVDEASELNIVKGRHPLMDKAIGGKFVPNDLWMVKGQTNIIILTGPNMGGKSTFMRQTGLIILLGQMGAAIPASAATWGSVSSIHLRMGAQDAITKGQSTFMVEMSELAHILHYADDRSLLLLDEIGRGTSTYDGMSVAWSVLEWLSARLSARTLFATHYHELTRLEGVLTGVVNYHLAVDKYDDPQASTQEVFPESPIESLAQEDEKRKVGIRFLYEMRKGPTQESFGIHVAQMAGLPPLLIKRAWRVLEDLEKSQVTQPRSGTSRENIPNWTPLEGESHDGRRVKAPLRTLHPVISELESLDINAITPIQGLVVLLKLQKLVKTQQK